MTATQIANHLNARQVGAGRWMAKCPAHPDHSASLSIREGRDGRTLVFCFAACQFTDILSAARLRPSDLFPNGPSPSPAQARQAAAERKEREQQSQKRRLVERVAFDRLRELHAIADELGSRLANDPEAPTSDAIAGLFHNTLDKIRHVEPGVADE
jgi:hypothetical protein